MNAGATWTAFADRPPCTEGQRNVVLGHHAWACGVVGLYMHVLDDVPLREKLAEYDPRADRYRDFEGMLPTHWAPMPDTAEIRQGPVPVRSPAAALLLGEGSMTELFDAAAAWRALGPQEQADIGVGAIVHILGAIGSGEGFRPLQGFGAADMEGLKALETAVRTHLSVAFFDDLPVRPDLSAIGVQSCRGCGCTDDHACPDGCSWVEPDLCSACAACGHVDI